MTDKQAMIQEESQAFWKLQSRVEKSVEKLKWEWLDRLINKWLDYYFQTQGEREETILTDKEQYREFLLSQLKIYVNYFDFERKSIDWVEHIKIRAIENKYHHLIFDWDEFNPVEHRLKQKEKEKLEPKPLWIKWKWIVARSISTLTDLFK